MLSTLFCLLFIIPHFITLLLFTLTMPPAVTKLRVQHHSQMFLPNPLLAIIIEVDWQTTQRNLAVIHYAAWLSLLCNVFVQCFNVILESGVAV